MKRQDTIYTILMIVTLLTALAGAYALYICIFRDNEPNWTLPIALFLVTAGNLTSFFANRMRKKNEEKNNDIK